MNRKERNALLSALFVLAFCLLSGRAFSIHEAGMVHRDLKPANVALTRGQTVIFDFGLPSSWGRCRATWLAGTST